MSCCRKVMLQLAGILLLFFIINEQISGISLAGLPEKNEINSEVQLIGFELGGNLEDRRMIGAIGIVSDKMEFEMKNVINDEEDMEQKLVERGLGRRICSWVPVFCKPKDAEEARRQHCMKMCSRCPSGQNQGMFAGTPRKNGVRAKECPIHGKMDDAAGNPRVSVHRLMQGPMEARCEMVRDTVVPFSASDVQHAAQQQRDSRADRRRPPPQRQVSSPDYPNPEGCLCPRFRDAVETFCCLPLCVCCGFITCGCAGINPCKKK